MTVSALTPSKVATTRIRKKPYIIHDKKLKGFYLKVYPSGRKTFGINVRRCGKRYDERIGHAAEITIKEAHKIAANKIDALTLTTTKASPLINTAFSAMAEVVFSRYERRWKPSTMAVNRYYLKNQILPFFGEKDVASITRADVEIWRRRHAIPLGPASLPQPQQRFCCPRSGSGSIRCALSERAGNHAGYIGWNARGRAGYEH